MGTHRYVLCLLVGMLLTTLNPSLAVFVNIDCGSNASYTDELSLEWTSDAGYIQNGEPKEVSFILIPPYVSGTVMSTLRAFPTLRKNCYTINVDKGEKVLVRTSFFYGNYDCKNSPPTFELQFDGNFWATVNTSSLNYIYEAIYVTKANTTSICLAQTLRGQIPFISALELRSLDSSMYRHVDPNHALFLAHRANSGTNTTVRYPSDVYDRIWEAETSFLYSDDVKSEAVSIDLSKAEDRPPPAVLQDAIVGTIWGMFARTIIYLRIEDLPDKSIPVYITAYFSDVAQLNATDKRSIDIYIDDVLYSRQINIPFGSVSVSYITNTTANSNTSISIRGSADSTLPPLINAYEVYSISNALTDGTNGDDVKGLAELQKTFVMLQKWSGDPCLPSAFSWEWLKCNNDASPRVTELNLSSFGLLGKLSDLSSLIALETIDLSNNKLDGPIPSFFGSLPNLKLLNLADNRFSGTIPRSLSSNRNLKLIVTGNCLSGMSCGPEALEPPSKAPAPIHEAPPSKNASDGGQPPNAIPPSNHEQPPMKTPISHGGLPPKAISPSNYVQPPMTTPISHGGLPPNGASPSNSPQPQTIGGTGSRKKPLAMPIIFPVSLLLLLLRNF
ncbi:hypothetical protein L6164_008149 [Bauhinia variegata]|uniref:Uncharacterized protein n=1 Tax=Bauhinia variegata TaxID=167791 RepID=A0ACB9PFR5_BAUVA|nr:hypothetical protein L6164_008149 [Bauhinia variegata]